MGMGTAIRVVTEPPVPPWPTREIQVTCSGCGAILGLTVYLLVTELDPLLRTKYEYLGMGMPGMTEQYCPVCGTAAG